MILNFPSQTLSLQTAQIETPLGTMFAIANQAGLYLLEFADRPQLEAEIRLLQKKTASQIVPGDNQMLEKLREELSAYFQGKRVQFSIPLLPGGTAFQHAVWEILPSIPAGETRSYLEIAQMLNKPTASRAVGNANGKNPIAIVIPCHRVIGADGSLGGYAGGIGRKQWLLDHEKQFAQT